MGVSTSLRARKSGDLHVSERLLHPSPLLCAPVFTYRFSSQLQSQLGCGFPTPTPETPAGAVTHCDGHGNLKPQFVKGAKCQIASQYAPIRDPTWVWVEVGGKGLVFGVSRHFRIYIQLPHSRNCADVSGGVAPGGVFREKGGVRH